MSRSSNFSCLVTSILGKFTLPDSDALFTFLLMCINFTKGFHCVFLFLHWPYLDQKWKRCWLLSTWIWNKLKKQGELTL
jgi:hypothetical protein